LTNKEDGRGKGGDPGRLKGGQSSVSGAGHQNRRMSKDYERLPKSSEAFIYVAMSPLMARRLTRS
jgi:hypothetical protein